MLVSQYIYTACGKRKNGDFVVWSKSPDITDAEGEEIHKVMTYKNPTGVNLYEATEEEIAAACPTKYAYFVLSTGKKVFAESNFIGRVYSDLDTRWGNFIIHAYVFNDLGDALPMSFLRKGLFKRKLEYREWHDEPCPDTLPQIEINPAGVNMPELEGFLTPERKRLLLPLLQAVMSAANGGPVVTFGDTEENQILWHTVLGLLLPNALREKVTFGSQVIPTFTASASVTGISSAKELTVRNLAKGAQVSPMAKHVVFDFAGNKIADVALDSYMVALGGALNRSLISALEYKNEIEKLCATYGCGSEQAVALYMLKYNKLEWFASFENYVSTLDFAEKCGMIGVADSANAIYRAVFINRQWVPDILPIQILKKLYTCCGDDVKGQMLEYYLAHLSGYGVSAQSAQAYASTFFEYAPFTREAYIRYMKEKNALNAGFAQNNDFNVNYLIYDTFLKEYSRMNVEYAYPKILEIFNYYAINRSYNELNLLISSVFAANVELGEGLVRDLADGFKEPANCTDLLFYLIENVKGSVLQLDLFKKLADVIKGEYSFISTYAEYYNRNTAVYAPLEQALVRDPQYASIQTTRETYAFRINPNVSSNDLLAYFKKYYISGVDDGLYMTKLREFLNSKRDARYAFEVFSGIANVNVSGVDMKDIYLCLQEKLYSPSLDVILNYTKQEAGMLEALDSRLESMGLPNSKGEYVKFVRTLLEAEKDKNVASQLIRSFTGAEAWDKFDEQQIDAIVRSYLSNLLELYVNFRSAQGNKGRDVEAEQYNMTVLGNLLRKPMMSRYFDNAFINVVSGLNSKSQMTLLTELFILASIVRDNGQQLRKAVLKRYVVGLPNQKKINKLLLEILDNTPEHCKVSVEEFAKELGLEENKKGKKEKKGKKGDDNDDDGNDGGEAEGNNRAEENGGETEEDAPKKKGFFAQIFGSKKKKGDK